LEIFTATQCQAYSGNASAKEVGYSLPAFQDSSDGQDNAIFTKASVTMIDVSAPSGFQHPVQAAHVARDGFDAVIVTAHLSRTKTTLIRQAIKGLVDSA